MLQDQVSQVVLISEVQIQSNKCKLFNIIQHADQQHMIFSIGLQQSSTSLQKKSPGEELQLNWQRLPPNTHRTLGVIPDLMTLKLKQQDCYKIKASLDYIVYYDKVCAAEQEPVSIHHSTYTLKGGITCSYIITRTNSGRWLYY